MRGVAPNGRGATRKMTQTFPSDPSEFDAVMRRIDLQLAAKGISIDWRPMRALGEVSTEYGIPLPLSEFPPGTSHPAGRNWPISKRIFAWYDERYGDRLKVHPGPGRMAILIEGDVWVFRFPLLYGKVKIVASRTIESVAMRSDGQPAIHNILDSIEKLPQGLRRSLSDRELASLLSSFILGMDGLERIQSLGADPLIGSAFADIDACVNHLAGTEPNPGLAKWASLQARY